MKKELPPDEVLAQAYQKSLSAYAVAKQFGISSQSVYRAIARAGVSTVGLHHYRLNAERYPREVQLEILRLYESGVRTPELVRKFGGSQSSIIMAIKRSGGQMKKPPGRAARISDEEAQKICDLYRGGMGQHAISAMTNHAISTIVRVLRISDVPLRHQRRNTRKGRYLRGDGYVLVRVSAADPMIDMANTKGLVPEHRLVMGRHIGRVLDESETVHHINNIRDDNRIDNLQLRQGKHGKNSVHVCGDCGSTNIVTTKLAD